MNFGLKSEGGILQGEGRGEGEGGVGGLGILPLEGALLIVGEVLLLGEGPFGFVGEQGFFCLRGLLPGLFGPWGSLKDAL